MGAAGDSEAGLGAGGSRRGRRTGEEAGEAAWLVMPQLGKVGHRWEAGSKAGLHPRGGHPRIWAACTGAPTWEPLPVPHAPGDSLNPGCFGCGMDRQTDRDVQLQAIQLLVEGPEEWGCICCDLGGSLRGSQGPETQLHSPRGDGTFSREWE